MRNARRQWAEVKGYIRKYICTCVCVCLAASPNRGLTIDTYGSGKNVKEPSSATLFDIGVVGDVTASAVVTAVVAVLIACRKALHSKACINFFPHYLSLPSLGCRIGVVGSGGRVVWAVTGTLSSTSTPKLPLILTVAVRRGRRRLLAHGLTKDLPTGTALAASRSHDKIEY